MIALIIHNMHICQCIMLFLTRTFDSFQPALEPFPQEVVIEAAWHTAAQVSQNSLLCFRAELRHKLDASTGMFLREAERQVQECIEKTKYVATICNQYLMRSLHFCDSGSCPSRAGAGKQTTGWPCLIAWPVYTLMSETGFCTTEWNSLNGVLCFLQISSTKSANCWRPSYCKPSSSKSMFGPQLPSIDKVHRITWWNWPFRTRETLSLCYH